MTRLAHVYIVRHGETAWSRSGQATGRTDIPLTDQGEREARALQTHLRGSSFALVLTSPLQRARRTAELAGFGDTVEIEPDLAELDYGEYEGRRTADIRAQRPRWRLFEDGCPGGETIAQAGARADRVIGRIRALNCDTLVFAHRDILRIVGARWVGLEPVEARRFYLDTASVSVLGYHHDLAEPVIRVWNDAPSPSG